MLTNGINPIPAIRPNPWCSSTHEEFDKLSASQMEIRANIEPKKVVRKKLSSSLERSELNTMYLLMFKESKCEYRKCSYKENILYEAIDILRNTEPVLRFDYEFTYMY